MVNITLPTPSWNKSLLITCFFCKMNNLSYTFVVSCTSRANFVTWIQILPFSLEGVGVGVGRVVEWTKEEISLSKDKEFTTQSSLTFWLWAQRMKNWVWPRNIYLRVHYPQTLRNSWYWWPTYFWSKTICNELTRMLSMLSFLNLFFLFLKAPEAEFIS